MNFLQGAATGMLFSSAVIVMAQASGVFAQDPPANTIESRAPVGNAFGFQGRLEEDGVPSTGTYDFQFQLFDAASGNVNPSVIATVLDLQVTNGAFSTPLDFGVGAFQGQQRFIEVRVRPGASNGAFTTLPTRQELTPAPYALFAANTWSLTGNAATTPGLNFIGTVDNTPLEFRVNDFVAGRLYPSLSGANVVMGHSANEVLGGAQYATIAGGGPNNEDFFSDVNRVSDSWGTVGGGTDNFAGNNSGGPLDAAFATVAGGESNFAKAYRATIGGGASNLAEAEAGTVSGGEFNQAFDVFNYMGGGYSNEAGTDNADPADGAFAVVVGGFNNMALDEFTFVGGGEQNEAREYYSAVVGGEGNIAEKDYVFIGGGDDNVGTGEHAVIGGGSDNTAHSYSTIGGGRNNAITASNGVIGGGLNHAITGSNGVIGGGGRADPGDTFGNRVTDNFGFVGGGGGNMAGDNNVDTTTAMYGTIAGGRYNITNGFAAMIPGGDGNIAQGDYSFAAGRKAWTTATADGSFAWADSQNAEFMVADADTFAIRALGGVGINVASPVHELDLLGRARFRGATQTNLLIGAAGAQVDNMTLDLVKNTDATGAEVSARINFNGESGQTDHRGFIAFSTRNTADSAVTQRIIIDRDGNFIPQMAGLDLGANATANRWDTIYAVNALNTSDGRLKKNIQAIEPGLAEILQLQPRSFEWVESNLEGTHFGLIAQEAREVLPDLVRGSESGDEVLAIAYNELIPVLIKGMQEQQTQIDGLRGGSPASASAESAVRDLPLAWLLLAGLAGGMVVLGGQVALRRTLVLAR